MRLTLLPALTKAKQRVEPTSGFAHLLYLGILVIVPAVVFILVRLDFVAIALVVIILAKWRMFAVKPRFWAANVRANAVDLMVGLSVVIFMMHSSSIVLQLLWAVLYAAWLIGVKPKSSIFMITAQAFIGQFCALMALFLVWPAGPVYGLTILTGLFCFLAARHFFDTFDEPYARMLAFTWGYFGAALAWLLSHWLLFYRIIAQPTLLLSVLGYGLAVIYYLDHHDRLSKGLQRQFMFIMIAIVLVVLTFSDWGDKVV